MSETPRAADADLSATILDFAGPIFGEVPANVTRAEFERVATLVIDVWNALVMSTEEWGDAEPLVLLCREVRQQADDGDLLPSKMLDTLEARWRARFSDDRRRVVEWFVEQGKAARWVLTCR
ncbi:MAG: hypothetical protein ACHREM_20085, partial [Polyangiales bacterium]